LYPNKIPMACPESTPLGSNILTDGPLFQEILAAQFFVVVA
jgi:hypothetical protein